MRKKTEDIKVGDIVKVLYPVTLSLQNGVQLLGKSGKVSSIILAKDYSAFPIYVYFEEFGREQCFNCKELDVFDPREFEVQL